MILPSFEHYSGTNALAFVFYIPERGTLKVYFSYQTPVAFALNGKRTVRVNDWKQTTGKHLAAIDGGDKAAKSLRVSGEEFERKLALALDEFGGVLK